MYIKQLISGKLRKFPQIHIREGGLENSPLLPLSEDGAEYPKARAEARKCRAKKQKNRRLKRT